MCQISFTYSPVITPGQTTTTLDLKYSIRLLNSHSAGVFSNSAPQSHSEMCLQKSTGSCTFSSKILYGSSSSCVNPTAAPCFQDPQALSSAPSLTCCHSSYTWPAYILTVLGLYAYTCLL